MVFDARAAGISASIASTTPQRMPMSRFPRSDWLGSSTSPPLITRSNLSAGPIAASVGVKRPDSVAAAADPVSSRKWRRDNAGMLALPQNEIFYRWRMPRALAFRKPPIDGAGALAHRDRNARLRSRGIAG